MNLEEAKRHYAWVKIKGTTFTGHPNTTLCNTLRALCYMYFYLEEAGIKDPWIQDHPDARCYATGDDSMIRCKPQIAEAIKQSILASTTKVNVAEQHGLGQIVKEVTIGGCQSAQFCSKWIFETADGYASTRDWEKALRTRTFYTGTNADFVAHPGKHAKAIHFSVKA